MVLDDNGADILELDASSTDGASRHLFEQVESMVHEHVRAFLPAMLTLVPLGGLARVARLDSGIAEGTFILGKVWEQPLGALRRVGLRKRMVRHRDGDACDLDIETRLQATGSA